MDVQIAALCDHAIDYSGKLCLLGAFDTIVVKQLPAVHPLCSIALRMIFREMDTGTRQLRVVLIDEDGRSLLPKMEPTLDIRIPENSYFATVNLIFNLQGMKFEKTGQYSIDIVMDQKIVARIPLQVIMEKH